MKRRRFVPFVCSALCLGALSLAGSAGCGDGDPPSTPDGGGDAGVAAPDGGGPADVGPFPPDAGPDEVSAPVVTAVNPGRGAANGGTRVTVRGQAFAEPAEVLFGEAEALQVVVLDELSIAVTTPPGTVGSSVAVTVKTAGGEGVLQGAFQYVRDLALDAVTPDRVSADGGQEVTVTGRGFDEDTLVLFDRKPLRGATFVDETTIRGYVPALATGRPEIRVIRNDADVRRSDVLIVDPGAGAGPDASLQVDRLVPGFGVFGSTDAQEVLGAGLGDVTEVRIGGLAATAVTVVDVGRVGFVAPTLPGEGAYDVVVTSPDGSVTLPAGYLAYDEAAAGVALLGVTPREVSEAGGEVLTVVGRGFGTDAQVTIAAVGAPTTWLSSNVVTVTVPAGLPVGDQGVQLFTGFDSVLLTGAVTVGDAGAGAAIVVDAIDPATGPAAGGTAVQITGAGFTAGLEVRIADVPLADVAVVSSTELTARTVAGVNGPFDVVVRNTGQTAPAEGRLVDGFSYVEPFAFIGLEPRDGSMAGNTHVSIFGRGFSGSVNVAFDGVAGIAPELENGSVIAARTEPHRPGTVDVRVDATGETVDVPQGYTYIDPRLVTGGAWGGPIEGAVNVGVISFNGQPIPGMVVQLGYEADPRYSAVTDQNGVATVSSPEIRGAQTVTAGGVGVEFVTFPEINARNITMVASPHPQSPPEDAPIFPCPQGLPPPAIQGRLFRVKSSRDPVTSPTTIAAARITYSQANVFSPNPLEPAEQTVFLFEGGAEGSRLEEGAPFEIVAMRVGTVAVYGQLGDLDLETNVFTPRRMAIARSVPVAPETTTEGVQLSFDIELNGQTSIRLDSPPLQAPGPSLNAVFSFMNLRSDGVIPFGATLVSGNGPTTVSRLPAVAQSEFVYLGGSFTQTPDGALGNPFSLTVAESNDPLEDGVDLGPFLEMPQDLDPKPQELLVDGQISWQQGGLTPDLTTLNVVDVAVVSGACCLDLSGNGQCDPVEPVQAGSVPQQFNRWSVYARGGLLSYQLPRMPFGLQGFEPPASYAYVLQTALAPRFSFEEFVFNQFNAFFWRSWSVTTSSFVAKEETD